MVPAMVACLTRSPLPLLFCPLPKQAQAKFLPKQFFKCTKPAEAVSVS